MPEETPFQMITRAARRRALEAGQPAQAATTGATTSSTPISSAPAANVPSVAATTPTQQQTTTPRRVPNPALLVTPTTNRRSRAARQVGSTRTPDAISTPTTNRRGRAHNTAARQVVSTRTPGAVSSRDTGSNRSRRRRRAPFGRRMRRTPARPRAADGRQGASAGIIDAPQIIGRVPVEAPNQQDQDPLFSVTPFLIGSEDANEDQDRPERTPEGEELTPLLVPGNEAGEMMEWMEANALDSTPDAPLQQRILFDRCTSPLCPVPNTIPHDRGLYLHDGQLNNRPERTSFGLSNPPAAVWSMVDRVRNGTAQFGDQELLDAFARNHSFLSGPYFGEAASDWILPS